MFKTLAEYINKTIVIYFVPQREHRAVNVAIYVTNRKKHKRTVCKMAEFLNGTAGGK
jgi:hypothetical protein